MMASRRQFIGAGVATLVAASSPRATASTAERAFARSLVERAQREGAVSFYTSLDAHIVDDIVAPFSERFGLRVDYYRGTPAEISARVLQEALAGGIRADVVDVSDVPALLDMKRRGLLQPYVSPFAGRVSAEAKDTEGTWTACRFTHGVFQWNTTLGIAPPKRWSDLAQAKWKGKLATFADPGGSEAARLWTVAEAVGWDTLKRICANAPLLVPSVQTLTQIVEQGERPLAFDQNDNIALQSKLRKRATDFLFPADCVPTEIGAVALVKGSTRPSAGRLWVDWWLGDESQRILVRNGKVSSRTDIPLPKGFPRRRDIAARMLDAKRFAEQRGDILQRIRALLSFS